MINNYEIKTVNDEEVLYIFLDYSAEFAKINPSSKKTTLNKEISDYITNNKIKFKGTKVVLMAGGILLGSLLLKSPLPQDAESRNFNYATNVIAVIEDFKQEAPAIQEEPEIKPETENKENDKASSNTNKQTQTTNKINTSQKNSANKTTTSSKTATTNSKTTASTKNSTNKQTTPVTSNKTSTITTNTNKQTTSTKTTTSTNTTKTNSTTENNKVSTKQIVTVHRSNGTILNIELEEYIIGVVAAEMPASFHIEALKAQAIAARTYALKAIKNGTTLTDTVATQVYKDNNQLKALWGSSYTTYYNKIKQAVTSTAGLVMYYNNALINAYYHSTSNGYTEDATAVFGAAPYLKSVESPVDKNVASYQKTVTFTYEEISNKLGVPVTSLSNINIERNSSSRVDAITIDNNSYNGVKFRTVLGLRSTDFDIVLDSDNIRITTRGYGHGVGMSQYGANEYAKNGWSYSKILKHYYSGITIKNY